MFLSQFKIIKYFYHIYSYIRSNGGTVLVIFEQYLQEDQPSLKYLSTYKNGVFYNKVNFNMEKLKFLIVIKEEEKLTKEEVIDRYNQMNVYSEVNDVENEVSPEDSVSCCFDNSDIDSKDNDTILTSFSKLNLTKDFSAVNSKPIIFKDERQIREYFSKLNLLTVKKRRGLINKYVNLLTQSTGVITLQAYEPEFSYSNCLIANAKDLFENKLGKTLSNESFENYAKFYVLNGNIPLNKTL